MSESEFQRFLASAIERHEELMELLKRAEDEDDKDED